MTKRIGKYELYIQRDEITQISTQSVIRWKLFGGWPIYLSINIAKIYKFNINIRPTSVDFATGLIHGEFGVGLHKDN